MLQIFIHALRVNIEKGRRNIYEGRRGNDKRDIHHNLTKVVYDSTEWENAFEWNAKNSNE